MVMNGMSVYGIAGTTAFIVEAGFARGEGMTEAMIQEAKASFTKALTDKLSLEKSAKITQSRYINIGESFGEYIKKS